MYSFWNRITWGGDPDAVNKLTGLSPRDVYNINKSWFVMYAEAQKYGLQLFLGLFRLNPVSKTYFKMIQNLDDEAITKSPQFRAHVINLMASLNAAVTNIHQPEVVMALMNKLGESHRKRNVRKEHFDEVTIVVVDILKNQLSATDYIIESWARFITFIYKHIFEKLCEN